jgi:hypothetical protein
MKARRSSSFTWKNGFSLLTLCSTKELRDELVQILLPVNPIVTTVRLLENWAEAVPLE